MDRKSIAIRLAATVLLLSFAAPAAALKFNCNCGTSYSSFSSNQSREQGSQSLTPISLSAGEGGFFGGLATGYVVNTYRPAQEGAEDVTLSSFLDTSLSLFYSGYITPRFCFQVGSSFNLPTGSASLSTEERQAEMDTRYGELVEVTDAGQGTNANPGFAVAVPLGRLIVGLGLGFSYKGDYDSTADIDDGNVDPGDHVQGKFTLGWAGKRLKVLGGVKYMAIEPDKVGGEEVFKEGDMIAGNVKLEFKPRPWKFVLEAAYSTWYRGKRLTGDQEFFAEELKRYGDDAVVRAIVRYRIMRNLTLHISGRGHWVQANEFDMGSAYYDAGRTTLKGSFGFRYMVFPGVSLNGSVSYQHVKEEADASFSEDTTFEGFTTALNIETLL